MIPNITRGAKMGGLLVYLAGDGRRNEHEEQHIVAGDSATVTLFGYDVLDRETALAVAADLDQPRREFGVEVTRLITVQDPDGGEPIRQRIDASVWHCSLSLHADEGQLTDERWAAIASDFVDEMGFSETSGHAATRWVAVRHGLSASGNDHVHIALSLVREDGTKASTHNDFRRAQDTCRELEKKHGLQILESRERGLGERGVKPGEREQAARSGGVEIDSHRLERIVRAVATASVDEAEFVRRLHAHDVMVRPRFAAGRDDVIAGYSVAIRPSGDSRPVWFGGGRLARDLTLPRLRQGWLDSPEASGAAVVEWQATFRNPWRYTPSRAGREAQEISPKQWAQFTNDIETMRRQLRSVAVDDRSAWAHAARDASGLFAAWSARTERVPGPLAATARSLARSAHIPAHMSKPRPAELQSISAAASLLLLADPRLQGSAAAAMLLQQMGRTTVAIMDAHRAAGDAVRAKELADTMRQHVVRLRDELPPVLVLNNSAPSTESQAALGAGPGRPIRPSIDTARRAQTARDHSNGRD